MASSSMVHSASISSSRSCKYDVFLSFRGEDVRKTFIDHLYSSLERHLIATFKDDKELDRGENIGPALFGAIEESYIALVIFSKHYADSSWCLDELTHIMKCKEERGLIVLPVFYDVEPTDVRKQQRSFESAFAQHDKENTNKAQLWRNALVEASNISGWEPKNVANGHESEVIKKITDTVLNRMFHSNTNVDEELVGMTSRLKELRSLLKFESGGVRMVGIWGIGGSGKTTLANSLLREVAKDFHGVCTLENVREETSKCGLKNLQENILSSLFNKQMNVESVREGGQMIKNMALRRKVLLLLDDVSALDQLDALAGKHDWFGSGSRIIITTRDEHLLNIHKVDDVYKAKLLSDGEAHQLFNRHAYNEKAPVEDYERLSSRLVSYAAGLPLALKVLGSFLYDKTKDEWLSALDRLKDIPEMEVMEKLKVSYDGLTSDEKELFLDLACFFRGYENDDDQMMTFKALGRHTIGLRVLRQKALVTIKHGRFEMHDLVEEMGRHIVKGKHPHNPEKHSRVWNGKEIEKMYLRNAIMENDTIEAIDYYNVQSYHPHEIERRLSKLFKFISNMKKLRYLSVQMERHDVDVNGPDFLSNELRYIRWQYYGRSPFPDDFELVNLVVLHLTTRQTFLWNGPKKLPCLKELDLCSMDNLVATPDFDGLPCLQKLTLLICNNLKGIHPSLGRCKSLEYLDVSDCPKLEKFPRLVNMEKLKTLNIQNCHKIVELPEIQGDMESLEKLSLESIAIDVMPSSIDEHCTNLVDIHLSSLENLKTIRFNFDTFRHLKKLKLDGLGCFKDVEIPNYIGALSNLQELSLRDSGFSGLNFKLTQLTRLKMLNLSGCKYLVEMSELPSSLNVLVADDCESLENMGDCYKNCASLCVVSLQELTCISDGDELLEFMLQPCMSIENHSMVLKLHCFEVAKGFTPSLCVGSRCELELPKNWCNEFSGFLMCLAFKTGVKPITYVHIDMMKIMTSGDGDGDGVVKAGDGDGDGDADVDEGAGSGAGDANGDGVVNAGAGDGDADGVVNAGVGAGDADGVVNVGADVGAGAGARAGDSYAGGDGVGDTNSEDLIWGMDSNEVFKLRITLMGYVSFASLRETTWWNPAHKTILFHVEDDDNPNDDEKYVCSGIGVRLVERRSRAGLNDTSTNSSHYTPKLFVEDDSESVLSFAFGDYRDAEDL